MLTRCKNGDVWPAAKPDDPSEIECVGSGVPGGGNHVVELGILHRTTASDDPVGDE